MNVIEYDFILKASWFVNVYAKYFTPYLVTDFFLLIGKGKLWKKKK